MNYFSQNSKGMAIEYLSIQDLKDFPVIIPKSDLLKRCKNIFETLYLKKAAAKVKIINRELFKDTNTFNETKFQKSFLLEQLDNLKVYKKKIIKRLLEDDFKELDNCYDNGNYKSCLVLCGSILEAILLDWLSEIDKKDYYNKNHNENNLSLYGIIKRLQNLDIFDSLMVDKAHKIRLKRNLIHPKKYFNSNDEIDKKTCSKVLNNLKYIVENRGLK